MVGLFQRERGQSRMKNRMLCLMLTGVLLAGTLNGIVQGTEFSDNIETVEMMSGKIALKDEEIQAEVEFRNEEDTQTEENLQVEDRIQTNENFQEEAGSQITDEFQTEEDFQPDWGVNEGISESEEALQNEEIFVDENIFESYEIENDEYAISVFSDGNVDLLTPLDEESEELIEAMEDGQVLAMAPVALTEVESVGIMTLSADDGIATVAAIPDTTYKIISKKAVFCDEVWTEANSGYPAVENGSAYTDSRYRQCTVNRLIQYVDADGNTRTSPLYCLEATKMGLNPGSAGQDIKDEAISLITNLTMKKILYFGYGGPGDICDTYDPTCSHIDWSQNYNRYLFTHYALSKIYSGDVGYATATEIEHVGLNKFISYLKSLTIPNRKAVKVSTEDSSGNALTGTTLNLDLSLYREESETAIAGLDDSFDEGYQISPLMKVNDEAEIGNGLRITSTESDEWQILYWKTEEEYSSTRGPNKPRVLTKGKTVTLKTGGCFRIVFPETLSEKVTLTYEMSLYPVSFIMMEGDIQSDGTGFQDMGAYIYQDVRGKIKLIFSPASMGNAEISKISLYDGSVLSGAEFSLKAAEDLYSGNELIYTKGTEIEMGVTDENGLYLFENLIPGKYYLQESSSPTGYLLDTTRYTIKVKDGETVQKSLVNVPDLQGVVEIEKFVEGTKLRLNDAQFTIYSWNEASEDYSGTIYQMYYNETKKKYISPELIYDSANRGKFKIVETKNPQGYSGAWAQEISLKNQTGVQTFSFSVENGLAEKKIVEIQKICAEFGKTLTDAVFTIYEYSKGLAAYKTEGVQLSFDSEKGKYVSEELIVSDDNEGKFKIVETKAPKDYEGSWEQEINILEISQPLQFIVENTPVDYPEGKISIKKTDCLTGENLEDAGFTIYEWNVLSNAYLENPFDCIVMKYDAVQQKYLSGDLEVNPYNDGKFKIVETKNPKGYTGNWEKEVQLTESALEMHFDVQNDPEDLPLGSITVVKKIKEDEITWAHGNPVFHFVVEGTDKQGKNHKYENYVRFAKGNYTVDGSGYATLSCVFSKIPIGTYEVYEKSVLRYYLQDSYANTGNVSVIKGAAPSYGTEPKLIAYGVGGLSVGNENASITFVNQKKRYDDYSHTDVLKNVMSAASIING